MHPPVVSLRIDESSQVGEARRAFATLAERCGFDEVAKSNAAIVVTELATNLVKHARQGELVFQAAVDAPPDAAAPSIDLWALDRGPGVADLDDWLRDGYSTAGTRGAGMGAVRRLTTAFHAYTQRGQGTVQYARLPPTKDLAPGSSYFQKKQLPPLTRVAGLSVPVAGETVCGDAWATRAAGDRTLVLVADGLGHGPAANQAAVGAIEALHEATTPGPLEVLQLAQQKLLPTRGAAVAVAEIDPHLRRMRFAGVGNIGGFVVSAGKTQRMVSLNGVVGVPPFRGRIMEYSFAESAVVVFFSDGLQSQVRMDGYEGLINNDPAVVAGVLFRDFRRGRDDATAVAVRVGT